MRFVITLRADSLEDTTKAGVSFVVDLKDFTPDSLKAVVNNLADLICLPEFKNNGGI